MSDLVGNPKDSFCREAAHITMKHFPSFQDSEYYNSMCYIRDNDPEPLDLYFSIEEDYFGEVSNIQQVP